jgi:outer membrane murein-binding lipoprotein Lpp
LIWVIVIVVVVVIAAAVARLAGRRRNEQRRVRAEQLRDEASTHAAGLAESERQAEELRAKAELARSEAARAEERAANAEQGHRVEQAGYEDKLREADRLDPEVDVKSSEYEPDVWNDERTETSGAAAPGDAGPSASTEEATGPRHAAGPETTTATQRTEDPEAEAAAPTSESESPRKTT